MSFSFSISATVALVLLFFPKVYIILLHPEKNVRASYATTKLLRCHFGNSQTTECSKQMSLSKTAYSGQSFSRWVSYKNCSNEYLTRLLSYENWQLERVSWSGLWPVFWFSLCLGDVKDNKTHGYTLRYSIGSSLKQHSFAERTTSLHISQSPSQDASTQTETSSTTSSRFARTFSTISNASGIGIGTNRRSIRHPVLNEEVRRLIDSCRRYQV